LNGKRKTGGHAKEINLNEGHRGRLLDRFEKNGLSALSDHEIIELLLSYVLPRRDLKPIAKKLLAAFSTVNGVISAPVEDLMTVAGIKNRAAGLFHLCKEIMSFCLKEKYSRQSMMTHRGDVEEYLRFHFGLLREEYVVAIFLDSAHHVIASEIVAKGTVNQCAVYPREVVSRALKNHAASLILAHNHPGGGKTPSEEDWAITKRLIQIGKLLDIPLLDHIIIADESTVGLRDFPRWSE
jgi:DNA repair protein RadC